MKPNYGGRVATAHNVIQRNEQRSERSTKQIKRFVMALLYNIVMTLFLFGGSAAAFIESPKHFISPTFIL